jgi:hypothetical protein
MEMSIKTTLPAISFCYLNYTFLYKSVARWSSSVLWPQDGCIVSPLIMDEYGTLVGKSDLLREKPAPLPLSPLQILFD